MVSNEDYLETKIKLEEQGTDFIRLSDCCRGEDKSLTWIYSVKS